MSKFTATYDVTGSLSVTVEADSLAEAKRLLEEDGIEGTELCVQCSGYSSTAMRSDVQFSLELDDVTPDPDDLVEETS